MKTFQDGMKIAMLRFTPELLAQMFTQGNRIDVEVVKDGLPEDVKVYQCGAETMGTGDRLFYMLVTSEQFKPVPIGDDIPILPAPIMQQVDRDTPLTTDARRN